MEITTRKKLFFIFLLFSIILSIGFIILEEAFFGKSAQKVALQNGVNKTEEREGVLKSFILNSKSTLKAIRDLEIFQDYLNKKDHLDMVSDIFLGLSKSQPSFMQLRYLDENGSEQIRVDRDRYSSEPYLIERDKLQNKAHRYYFSDSKNREFNKVWFSEIDLNIEFNRVEIPYKPTLRAVLPIEVDGKFRGIIVINYFMKEFLARFFNTPLYDAILCNRKGEIIQHYDDNRSWSRHNNFKFSLKDEFPENYQKILKSRVTHTDKFVSRVFDTPIQNGLILILQLKKSYIKEQKIFSAKHSITITLMTILLSILLSLLVVKYYSHTLLNLKRIRELSKFIEIEKERYKTFMKYSSDALFILDFKGNIIEFSERAREFLGYTAEEMKGLTLFDIDVKHSKDTIETILHSKIENVKNIETLHKRKDGSLYFASVRATLVQIGEQIYIYLSVRDITKEREYLQNIEKEALRKNLALKSGTVGVWEWIYETNTLNWDETMFSIYGIDCKEFREKENPYTTWSSAIDIEDRENAENNLFSAKQNNEEYNVNFWITTKSGERKYIHAVGVNEFDERGKPFRMVGINTDITQQKIVEDTLKEDKKRAEKISETKSNFLANMSHEIRTPLNGVIGLIDMVLETELNSLQREYLTKSKNSSHALLHVINDILDYSKIEAGKLEILDVEFKFDELLKNVSDLFGYIVNQKGIEFGFTIDHTIPNRLIGDTLRITQILNNLVGNSIKFTEKGYIIIDVSTLYRDKDSIQLKFVVKDSGIGINRENQKRLFEPFEQGDSSNTKKFGGSGLGLMISKRLVELMNGDIWVESREGVGTQMSFTLNLKFKESDSIKHWHLKELEKSKFLIVEDNLIEREYLSNILSSWKLETYEAKDGEEAFSIIKDVDFDYVLLDWDMPILNGIDLLVKLRDNNIDITNILMVTSYGKSELIESAKKENVKIDRILQKPYTPSTLYNVLINREEQQSFDKGEKRVDFQLKERKKALIVEDNDINQLVAKSLLNSIGFDTTIAVNGADGVETIKRDDFDIVFMDLQMPIMDGYEASREIRKFNKSIPIIALSAAVMSKEREESLQAGMNYHIAKPIDYIELQRVLKEYFALSEVENFNEIYRDNIIKIDGVLIDEVAKNFDNIESVYEMYKEFKNSYFHLPQQLEKILLNSKEFKEIIHKLKGVSGNLKIINIFRACEEIEQNEDISENLKTIKSEIKRVSYEIEEKISPLVNSEKKKLNLIELKELLSQFRKDLNEYNYIPPSKTDLLFKELENYIEKHLSQTILELYNEHKFDQLISELNTILESLDKV